MSQWQFMTYFDDVLLPSDALVGHPGEGLAQVFHGLNPERIAAAALNNGIARYALACGIERYPGGQAPAHALAKAHVAVESARLMTGRAAALCEAARASADAAEAAHLAKLAASDAVLEALEAAMGAQGLAGLTPGAGLADLWFIARLSRSAPVSREMALNHLALHSLGLQKGY